MKNVYMIGHTHFDPVWLWRWDEAMASIHSTFRSALDRMEEDSEFVYSFATPPVFEWIKQIDPDMFEQIRARVAQGRWELCEGWWLQPDCFSASGESYARHSLYGQRYLMENFGIYSDTVFNVDSFGHNSAIPQILKKSHMGNYCFCRPESYHTSLPSPYFLWRSKDGSAVRAFRAGEYGPAFQNDIEESLKIAEEAMKDASCDELMIFGVTNHGGGPTKKAISEIHRLNGEKDYTVKCSTVKGYFEAQGEPKHTVDGELITKDFGVYTNNHEIKRRNRVAEYAALNAERAALIAKKALNRPYPKEKLTECWKDILFNQFHDIIGGACIKDAYIDAYNSQGRATLTAEEITHYSLQAVTRKMKMPGKNPENPWNLVIWNLNDHPYDGYVEAEVQWLHEFPEYSGEVELMDEAGVRYPCQMILEKSVIIGFRSRFLFRAVIPAMGYHTFKVIKTERDASILENDTWKRIETSAFDIEFDETSGLLGRVYSKKTGKEYHSLIRPECYADEGDTWCFNIQGYGEKLEDFALKSVQVTESGRFRTVVKVCHSFRDSLLTLYYTFYNDEDYFDVRYVANWNESHTVLKLSSHTGVETLKVSSPFCVEDRCDTERDVPMGEWLTMADEDGGISMIADSLFSYTKQGDKISLSILRSCIYGDLRLGDLNEKADYPYIEQGISEGSVRVVIHKGDYAANRISEKAVDFNNQPIVISEANHDGILPSVAGYIDVRGESVSVTAIKECESDESVILRLYEHAGKAQNVCLNLFGFRYEIPVRPFEIKTVRLDGKRWSDVFITEDGE